MGAEKDDLWDWNRCACHCLNIAVQAALKEPMIEGCLAPLTALACKFSKSRSAWNRFKKTQLEILNWEEERSDDEREADFDGDEDFEVGGEGQSRLKKVLRLVRPVATRWNSMYYLIKRALALKDSLVMFTNSEGAHNGESPTMSPVDDNVEVFLWRYSCTRTFAHPSYAPKLCSRRNPKIPKINVGYWRSYEDLEECMEPVKQLSLLLESSTEPTIHNMLDYFLRLLYEKLDLSPKRHIATCAVFNALMDTFRKKLLMLLDDMEQFFLWVVAAMLDGRRIGFHWLNPVGENKSEWPNVTKEYRTIQHLMSDVRRNIADQVRVDLSLSMSITLKCGPQVPTLLLGLRAVDAQEDPRM